MEQEIESLKSRLEVATKMAHEFREIALKLRTALQDCNKKEPRRLRNITDHSNIVELRNQILDEDDDDQFELNEVEQNQVVNVPDVYANSPLLCCIILSCFM
jgi:hypothetical protein